MIWLIIVAVLTAGSIFFGIKFGNDNTMCAAFGYAFGVIFGIVLIFQIVFWVSFVSTGVDRLVAEHESLNIAVLSMSKTSSFKESSYEKMGVMGMTFDKVTAFNKIIVSNKLLARNPWVNIWNSERVGELSLIPIPFTD